MLALLSVVYTVEPYYTKHKIYDDRTILYYYIINVLIL